MKRAWISGLLSLLIVVVAFAGGDPWKTKSFTQRNTQECLQVLQDSPWAHKIEIGSGWHPAGQMDSGGTGMAVQGGQTGPGGANGVESKTLSPGDISEKVPRTYVVTWWSAHSVQQASMRRAVLSNLRPASEQDNFKPIDTPFYQVMIYGPDMSVFQKRGNKSFIDKAYLQPKGTKSKIMPAKVEFETAPDGRVTASIFSFPKKDEHGEDTIAKNEKHVDFYCNIADVWLKTFFEPDKMVAASGPDW